jgi:hypothetical protein
VRGRLQKKPFETERTFRDANKGIGAVAEELADDAQVPFLCECDDPACRRILRAPWQEFAALHERDLFVVAPGHQDIAVEDVVATSQAYTVVRK